MLTKGWLLQNNHGLIGVLISITEDPKEPKLQVHNDVGLADHLFEPLSFENSKEGQFEIRLIAKAVKTDLAHNTILCYLSRLAGSSQANLRREMWNF